MKSATDMLHNIRSTFIKLRAGVFKYPADTDFESIRALTPDEAFIVSNLTHTLKHWMMEEGVDLHKSDPMFVDLLLKAAFTGALQGYFLGYLRGAGHEAATEELVVGTGCQEEETLESFRAKTAEFDARSEGGSEPG